jgi:hypothetical protein
MHTRMDHTDSTDSDALAVFARGLRELAQGGDDERVDSIPLHEGQYRLVKSESKDNMKIKMKKSEEEVIEVSYPSISSSISIRKS